MQDIDYRLDFIRSRSLQRFYDSYLAVALEDDELPISVAYTILFIGSHENQSLKQISERMDVDGAHTTRIMKILMDKGLVENRGNRKEYSIALTEKGDMLFARVRNALVEANRYLVADFTEEELEIAVKLMAKAKVRIRKRRGADHASNHTK